MASLGEQVNATVPADGSFSVRIEKIGRDGEQWSDGASLISTVFRLTKSIAAPLEQPITLQVKIESEEIGDNRRAALFAYNGSFGQWVEISGSLRGDV